MPDKDATGRSIVLTDDEASRQLLLAKAAEILGPNGVSSQGIGSLFAVAGFIHYGFDGMELWIAGMQKSLTSLSGGEVQVECTCDLETGYTPIPKGTEIFHAEGADDLPVGTVIQDDEDNIMAKGPDGWVWIVPDPNDAAPPVRGLIVYESEELSYSAKVLGTFGELYHMPFDYFTEWVGGGGE